MSSDTVRICSNPDCKRVIDDRNATYCPACMADAPELTAHLGGGGR